MAATATSLLVWISTATLLLSIAAALAIAAVDDGYSPRPGSRFLAAKASKVKKGTQCDPVSNKICPGIPAKNGTELLYCCKDKCKDVLADPNNCGSCGNKCGYGQLCCSGRCSAVAWDAGNCGDCGVQCQPGEKCEYGTCGYA